MLIVSYGMPKTGSTLLFELTKATLESGGHPQTQVTRARQINFTDNLTQESLAEYQEAARAHPLVLKTHVALTDYVKAEYAAGRLDVTIAIRDPRDIGLSLRDHGERARAAGRPAFSNIKSLHDAAKVLKARGHQTMQWIEMAPEKVYRYEDFAVDQPATVARLARQLGVTVEPQEVLSRMNGRFTQLNKGVVNRHQTELDADSQILLVLAAPALYKAFYQPARAAAPKKEGAGRLRVAS